MYAVCSKLKSCGTSPPFELGHTPVIFYPAAQPDHPVKHQKPPEAEKGTDSSQEPPEQVGS